MSNSMLLTSTSTLLLNYPWRSNSVVATQLIYKAAVPLGMVGNTTTDFVFKH